MMIIRMKIKIIIIIIIIIIIMIIIISGGPLHLEDALQWDPPYT